MREFLEDVCCSAWQYICSLLYITVINQFKDDLAIAPESQHFSLLTFWNSAVKYGVLQISECSVQWKAAEANWSLTLGWEIAGVFECFFFIIHSLKQIRFAIWIKAVAFTGLIWNRIMTLRLNTTWILQKYVAFAESNSWCSWWGCLICTLEPT